MEKIKLNNGILIPHIGYGTYKLPDDKSGAEAVSHALTIGYRLIDGASAYSNERAVGEGIRMSGINRKEIFVTSKVSNLDRGYDSTLRAFDKTMDDLRLDYLDFYLIHWPADPTFDTGWEKTNLDTWHAMERLYTEGRVRAIGLSNFMPVHLAHLIKEADIIPAVNQIEFNPGMQQPEIYSLCASENITVEAWSPLGRGRILTADTLARIARDHDRTVAQICLRWEIQKGVIPIPKSSNTQRMKENIDVFDFTLSDKEMQAIDSLPTFGNSGLTPENINSH